MEDNAVVIRNVWRHYGRGRTKIEVLKGIDITVPSGCIYGLLGASGCGKTTLLGLIAGRRSPASGEIIVLGGKPGSRSSGVPGPRIGYMPQDIALAGELTLKEVIWYFGTIFNMTEEQISERYLFLNKLLELPPGDRLIKNLSGGQRRRASFSAALVHSPELLILDEPTVGLDPLLRQNIWDYLVELTTEYKATIIITTHYIEEAQQAGMIGLMRQGKLLAENSPQSLLARCGCTSLEDAFLSLSMQQEMGQETNTSSEQNYSLPVVRVENCSTEDCRQIGSTVELINEEKCENKYQSRNSGSSMKRIRALLMKNFKVIFRNPGWLMFILMFPILEISVFFAVIGKDPKGLTIAVVNEELGNLTDCTEASPWNAYLDEEEVCRMSGISCLFINGINDTLATKKYYTNLDDAIKTVKDGKAVGVLHFHPNFTNSLEQRQHEGHNAPDDILVGSEIATYMDMSDRVIGIHLQTELYNLYNDISEKIVVKCGLSPKLIRLPMQFNDPIYGSEDGTYAEFITSGIICSMIYFLATTLTCTVLITEQLEGVWDRNLVSGVTVTEILFSHIVCQMCWMLLQLVEVLILSFFAFNMTCQGDIFTLTGLLFLQGICGMCYGLVVAVISKDLTMANYLSLGTFFPFINLSGVLWPKEGMPIALKWFSYFLPTTLANESLRYILERGWSIARFEVYSGFLITLAWIVGQCLLCLFVIRIRKIFSI